MKKNINKIIAFAIGISVINGSIIPALAANNAQSAVTNKVSSQNQVNQKPVLTLDSAIESAISSSETLQLDTKKITYQDNVNDINEDLDDFNNVSGDQEDFNDDTRDATSDKLRQQRDFDEDILKQKVITAYNNIVTNQVKIDTAAKELEVKNKELENTKLKESLGITTSTDLKSAELEILNLQNTQKARENALKDLEYSFKVLTGKDVTQYTLEQDVPYEALKIDDSIDDYLNDVISTYLKYSEQILKLKKDYYYDSDNKVTDGDVSDAKETTEDAKEPKLSDYFNNDNTDGFIKKDDFINAYDDYKTAYDKYEKDKNAYNTLVSARLAYLANKLSVDTDQTTINENKKNFKNQLKTLYTNLLTSEDNINYLKKNIEVNNKKLSDAKLKYDLGMITESDYNTQVVNSENLNLQLRNEIINHNTLKEEIQKPWIVFSN